MEPQTTTFPNKAGLKIFTRTWLPQGDARGVVVIVHGLNSHSGYYQWVADQFTDQNYAVYALDLQGRGQSEGERFYVESIYDYINDIDTLVDSAKADYPGLPVFMLGHSAGGVLSCIYTLEHQEKLTGLICESFAYQVPAPDFALTILKGLSHIAPHLHTIKLKNEDFSRDTAVVDFMNNDPLIANESQPTKTMEQLVLADERLKKEFPKITIPVFIIHGTKDNATKYSGSQFFYDTAGSSDKTLKLYEGHYHDLLNDVDKEIVITDIKDWVIKHS
ncbi:alpha/beta hydrolase [Cytophagaceae bacterium DM2B3-1]|uniref:Alpha/beta hydrolase n=1 Tax=Xanthocytophaga flava TaxID=3048013 RepID=A0ABT7CLY1_9BACT|nr:lysophospholipase [Xanthocytophaga flavus]MDJ1494753.1 alpha/beta hydrolase [Xanthocytophaga flavus]